MPKLVHTTHALRPTAWVVAVSALFTALLAILGAPLAKAQTAKKPPPAKPQAISERYALRDRLNQNTTTVISGNPNGTYLYLAYDMSAVLDDGDDLRVLPVIGKGGYQNVIDILHLKGVDLGITQSNIMSYLKKSGEFGSAIDRRLGYITKLYNEEVHILAGAGIEKIEDLTGKKVNFSDVGSGTQFSTRLIFELLGIKPVEVNMGQTDGYLKVKSGEIAATVLIAGKPAGSFGKFALEPGMKLLSVPYTEKLEDEYFPAKLNNSDYPNLVRPGETVDTVAVGAVLAVYLWPRDHERYERVARFVDRFFSKFPKFREAPRHAKWRETNLAAPLKGWTRFPAAQEWLETKGVEAAQRGSGVVVDPTLARAQAERAAPGNATEQERLFQQFLDWSKRQSNAGTR